MTVVPYTALVARLDAAQHIAYLRDLTEPDSIGAYPDEWPLHFAGYDAPFALAVGDAITFVAQLNKYDALDRRLCTDLPSLAAERAAPYGAFIDLPMSEVTPTLPFTYRFETPTEIVTQERLVRVFHLAGWGGFGPAFDETRLFKMAHQRGALDEMEGCRALRDAGWRPVYYGEHYLVMPAGVIHMRVIFMRPIAPH